MYEHLKAADASVHKIMMSELARQREGAELIPSENLVSVPVLEALGSVFTNKYSEGYPGKRYYAGNEHIDEVELMAIERAKILFGAEHVNVQPLSGSPANMAIYQALMEPGDKLMALKLDHGGHLTHGHPVNFSGKLYTIVHYEVDKKTEQLDYDAIEALAVKEKPKILLAGYTAYARDIDWKRFKEIADKCGAYLMGDISHTAGLVAGKQLPNPVDYCDVVMTTTHKTLRGPRGAIIMCKEPLAKAIDKAVFPGMQGGPHENAIAAKAVAFGEALKDDFKLYAKQCIVNAKAMAAQLEKRGARLVSGGTDTHLILMDVRPFKLNGKKAEAALGKADIYCNKNTIPYDTEKPFVGSGVRLGTPCMTTRGMKEEEMTMLADHIVDALEHADDDDYLAKKRTEVIALCKGFPIYKEIE
ncbi:serine hydroxymethyltransferase [Candidatus Woesearchaeota archaeon]|nr:serine hydroxymethyltransferase [Candidatus Woesearchaeota archaeon]